MSTQCNLSSPLSLHVIDVILNRLLDDQENKPELAMVYEDVIKHYQNLKLTIQGSR